MTKHRTTVHLGWIGSRAYYQAIAKSWQPVKPSYARTLHMLNSARRVQRAEVA